MLESVAFSLGPIHVRWYGIILGTAALIGLLFAITGRETIRNHS